MTGPHEDRCHITDSELLAYRDGELAIARQATMSAHIAACSICRQRLTHVENLADTLQRGSPLIDQPVARATIQARIAGEHTSWWRHPALAGGALPVVLLIVLALGVVRWSADDACTDCPPPVPMRVTSSAGLPVGWQVNALCQELPLASRMRPQGSLAQPPRARHVPDQTQWLEQPPSPHSTLPVARMPNRQQRGANDDACGTSDDRRRLAWSNGPQLGLTHSQNDPGT